MTDSIGRALQKWFLANNIYKIDHPLFVDVTDHAFHNCHTFGNGCVDAVERGGKNETDMAKELMRRLIAELPN